MIRADGAAMTTFRSTGVLRYSPTLKGSLARRDGGTTKWWLILDCDPDLGRYCRHLFHVAAHRTQALQSPLWDAHVSIIANESPPLLGQKASDHIPVNIGKTKVTAAEAVS